jgi:adenine phosphoribosyltransferase
MEIANIRDAIRTIPDYPKKGIMFRDITTLIGHAKAFAATIDALAQHHADAHFDHVAGIEARGFIIGGAVAHRLGLGFIPIRKKGKLPWETIGQEYTLEYGTDVVEIHKDAVRKNDCVLLVDDLIATGGTAEAAVKLIARAGGRVTAASFVIDLPELGGRARIESLGVPVITLVEFEGE